MAAGGRGRGQRRALQSGARRMHHPVEGAGAGGGGAESLCSAGPSRSKVCWEGWGGGGARGLGGVTGLVDNVERDAISPGRAPGTSQSTQRAALSETRRPQVKPPPKRQTPADWRLPSPDHWSGAAGAPEQWKCTLSHLLSRRCHTRVSSDWLERGRPVASTNCVSRM